MKCPVQGVPREPQPPPGTASALEPSSVHAAGASGDVDGMWASHGERCSAVPPTPQCPECGLLTGVRECLRVLSGRTLGLPSGTKICNPLSTRVQKSVRK